MHLLGCPSFLRSFTILKMKNQSKDMTLSNLGASPTWNESSQGLVVLVSIPVGLPPVGVVLTDDMQDVSLLKRQSKLPAWQEGIIRWFIVKVSPNVDLRTEF